MKWNTLYLLGIGFALLTGCSSGNDAPSSTNTPATPQAGAAQALPLLSVTTTDTQDPITSKEVYRPARYVLKDEARTVLIEGVTEIRGRGNSTWALPKKPYHLKLGVSSSFLNMPANRHWVLLANYADKTLLRNDITFQISRWMGMEYTPRSKPVEVELNGEYLGIYQLTEHIRIAPDRVNIPALKIGDTTPDRITGGYLLELDAYRGEAFCFDSARLSVPFCLKNPETLLEPGWESQRAYIEQYIQETEDAIFGNNFTNPTTGLGYEDYLDVDSMIQYYLVNELVKNVDGGLWSTYLYKKRNGKLFFGPVWDFDIAIGNVPGPCCDQPDGWYIRLAPWFDRLFQDPAFATKVTEKWNQFRAAGYQNELFRYIDNQALYLSHVQAKNFQKWDILSIQVWPYPTLVTGSYQGEVTAMRNWLQTRVNWMDNQFNP